MKAALPTAKQVISSAIIDLFEQRGFGIGNEGGVFPTRFQARRFGKP
jgi:hypothetical protein